MNLVAVLALGAMDLSSPASTKKSDVMAAPEVDIEMPEILRRAIGHRCCRQRVGEWRSLSIGLGEKVFRPHPRQDDRFYGEWEFVTYFSSWRVVRDGRIACSNRDTSVDTNHALDDKLARIEIGILTGLRMLSRYDMRLEFDNDLFIDFLGTIVDEEGDEDEMVHVFCPEKMCAAYGVGSAWRVGRSDVPWT